MRIPLKQGEVDLDTGTVVRDGAEVRLREKERQLLAYLVAQAGRTVPRSELYAEVWGYHPATSSRTLDSTVRRLRKAIEPNPRSPVHVLSEVGVGYRYGAELAPAAVSQVPWAGLDTPYHPRPDDEEAVRALLQGGWAVVTVVGPGGVGKTRLVRQLVEALGDVVAVNLGSVGTVDEVWTTLASAAGTRSAEPEVVVAALAARQAVVVLDEAEGCLGAVREVVKALEGRQVLVTSQAHLGLRGEAVHQLEGLAGPEGRAFLADRLAASRWSESVDDEVLDRALRLFDGLPLGLELAASQPEGLERLLDEVQREGRTLQRLQATLRRSYEAVSASGRALLEALAVAEAPLTAADLADWLGDEVALALETLAERSMVERRGGGWRLLRTTRRFVRSERGDLTEQAASYHRWLARRGLALEEAFLRDPARVGVRWQPLVDDQRRALASLPPATVGSLARALFRYHDQVGPGASLHAVVQAAALAAPSEPAVVAMNVAMGLRPLDDLALADAAPDPVDQVFAYEIRVSQAARTAEPARAEALARTEGLSEAWQAIARLSGALAAGGRIDATEADVEAVRQQVVALAAFPGLQGEAMQGLSELLRARGAYAEALAWLDRAIPHAQQLGLSTHEWVSRHYRARLLGDMDPALGADAFLEGLPMVERLGGFAYYDRIRAGLLRYLEGRLPDAAELLSADAERTGGETQILARVVRHLVELRLGGPRLPTALVVPESTGEVDPHAELRRWLVHLVDAEMAVASGQLDRARTELDTLRAGLSETSSRMQWQLAEELAARVSGQSPR
jgi:DNA-binding winged helix-turn-helix (wHTH) protein